MWRSIFSELCLSVLYGRLYSPPEVGLLKSPCCQISLEAEGNGWPNVCVQTEPAGHICPRHSFKEGGQLCICWLATFHHSNLGIAVLILRSHRGRPHGQASVALCVCMAKLLPRCSSALTPGQPWNSPWKMRSHLVTPWGRTTAGGGQCSKRSTLGFGIDIESHGISLESSGIFQASNCPSMLKRLPLFPTHGHHQNYYLLSFYQHSLLLLPLTPRGQLLRCHLSLFVKTADTCMHEG